LRRYTKVITLMIGVFSFAVVFAINSSIHSYLVAGAYSRPRFSST
jgi:hypothetical protein